MTKHSNPAIKLIALVIPAITFAQFSNPAFAYKNDENWPCVQAKMKKITSATLWPGILKNDDDTAWNSNKDVQELLKKILPRRVKLEETEKIIAEFVKRHGDESPKLIELTFAAALQQTNSTRTDIIGGIGRFTKRQQDLAKRIKENRRKVTEFEKKDEAGSLTKEEDKEFAKYEQQLEWDIRIHEEREQSLDQVCEAPVIISQRLYEISKQLQKFHGKKSAKN